MRKFLDWSYRDEERQTSALTAEDARSLVKNYETKGFAVECQEGVDRILNRIKNASASGKRSITFYPSLYLYTMNDKGILVILDELRSLGYKVKIDWNSINNTLSAITVFTVSW